MKKQSVFFSNKEYSYFPNGKYDEYESEQMTIRYFVDQVTEYINDLGDKFISVHYPSNNIAIVLYNE